MHRAVFPRAVLAAVAVTALATLGVGHRAEGAADPTVKCRQAILRGAAKLADARLGALRKCEDAKRAGKLPVLPRCPDEPAVAAGLARQTTKLAGAIDKACGGADKRCGGADDVGLAAIAWPNVCPDLEGSGCAAPLASCADVSACVACLADAAVARGVDLAYAPLVVADPKTQKAIVKCQKALTAAATGLADARLAANARCLAARLAGKHDQPCPFPGDGKAAPALAKARAKAEKAVCKACGGVDKACGGGDDLGRDVVGIASACPGVGMCETHIDGLVDLVDCFACSAAARADCALAAAAPGIGPYPSACADVPPTPTPTTTPTPTLTASATPTLTPSPSPTATPIFCARDVARTANVTITITTGGPLLGAANMTLDYDPERVRLDGAADDSAVRAAVTDLTAGALLGKGQPNNQDTDGDLTPDRVRFGLVAQNGVAGALLRIAFGACVGAPAVVPADFTCDLVKPVGTDGKTNLSTAMCTIGVENLGP
jgi:hypothetical protein